MSHRNSSNNTTTTTTTTIVIVGCCSILAATVAATSYVKIVLNKQKKRERNSQWTQQQSKEDEELPSILAHFKSLNLDDPGTTVEEANKRRTAGYYEKAREAHLFELVRGESNYALLVRKRREVVDRIMRHWREGTKSHRTVIVMCDSTTTALLDQARCDILKPLCYSTTDIHTRGVWIPALNIIPPQDMHVTVAVPWWWHSMREGNYELSKELASRFRQTLVLNFHHPFQIELERIVLLGGKILVALWRCVGERRNEDGDIIYDRHGESVDPFVWLREKIVDCFTTESEEIGRKPLTYTHKHSSLGDNNSNNNNNQSSSSSSPPPKMIQRQNSIEFKTPGLGHGDGFIHTTLCRLPLDCLSQSDVNLEHIHRLCREATATYCGHRMVVSKFRFLETTGLGGESNPCVGPIYDETIDAPVRYKITDAAVGTITETENLHEPKMVTERNNTIGYLPVVTTKPSVLGFFPSLSSDNQQQEQKDASDDRG